MRQYCFGAVLLDLEGPVIITGRMKEPLMTSDETERDGDVPMMVFSCGTIINNG